MRSIILLTVMAGSGFGATLYQATAGGFGFDLDFNSVVNPNSTTATDSASGINTSYSSSANLLTGALRTATSGSVLSTSGGDSLGSAFASYGDTFDLLAGTGTGGLHLGANVQFSGAWTQSPGVVNWSVFRIYVLKDGSFDTPNSTAPANVISMQLFGFGPGATQPPFLPTLNGFSSSLPTSFVISLPAISDLPSRFQVLVTAQILLTSPGSPNESWNADLSHTITTTLLTPDGVSLTSAGGSPVSGEVPEPSTLAFGALGLVAIGLRFAAVRRSDSLV